MSAQAKHKETALGDGNYFAIRRHELALAARRRLDIEPTIVPPAANATSRTVATDLPSRLTVMREELAIWRAFLSEEIAAIMRDDE